MFLLYTAYPPGRAVNMLDLYGIIIYFLSVCCCPARAIDDSANRDMLITSCQRLALMSEATTPNIEESISSMASRVNNL
ncbi:MAG TPA: hypothetical protein DIT83_08880 [Barnesiella intestinihominis]|nr:hypothetical protein [Barnesiella intestinihominis]